MSWPVTPSRPARVNVPCGSRSNCDRASSSCSSRNRKLMMSEKASTAVPSTVCRGGSGEPRSGPEGVTVALRTWGWPALPRITGAGPGVGSGEALVDGLELGLDVVQGVRVGALVGVDALVRLLREVLVRGLVLRRLGVDADVGDRVAAVAAGGVRVAAVAGDAGVAADTDAVGLAAVAEVDVGLALLVDAAGDAAEAEAAPAVGAAPGAAERDAAGAAV